MKSFKLLFFSLSLSFLASCGSGNQKPSSLFGIVLEGNTNTINQDATIGVSIKNIKNKNIEKVTYFMDGEELPISDGKN